MHAHPLSIYLPSRTKLWCTLQLRGQINSHYFYSTPTFILWFRFPKLFIEISHHWALWVIIDSSMTYILGVHLIGATASHLANHNIFPARTNQSMCPMIRQWRFFAMTLLEGKKIIYSLQLSYEILWCQRPDFMSIILLFLQGPNRKFSFKKVPSLRPPPPTNFELTQVIKYQQIS